MPSTLHSVNLGRRRAVEYADTGYTGIDKRPVAGRVKLTALGVAGDQVCDTRHHGGPDQAVYAYAREDAAWWATELDRAIHPGGMGENLSTVGVDVTGTVVGERWAIGDALLEVAQPRTPCRTFAGFLEVPDLIRRFTEHAAPGAYLRVLRDGEVGAGDLIMVAHRPAHGVTVGEVFRAVHREPDLLPRLLEAPELPAKLRDRARRRLGEI